MIRSIGFMLLLLSAGLASAQVGINNNNPNPASVLDVKATGRGILIPRMTKAEREGINVAFATVPSGLLVYDETLKRFCFFDGSKWFTLNEWVQDASTPGSTTYQGNVTVDGTVAATDYGLNAKGHGPVPARGIIMWSGPINEIPTGWALCNGQNGTPDMRDRFIVGAGLNYTQGQNGGRNSVRLQAQHIPHHAHTGIAESTGAHSHVIFGKLSQKAGTATRDIAVLDTGTDQSFGDYSEETSTEGIHAHVVTIGTTNGAAAAEGADVDIRPIFLALAYIMKLP